MVLLKFTVKDTEARTPVAGVSVSSSYFSGITNSLGKVEFEIPSRSSVRTTFSKAGYNTNTTTITALTSMGFSVNLKREVGEPPPEEPPPEEPPPAELRTVYGFVFETGQIPLQGATVSGWGRNLITDSNGWFVFEDVPNTTYTVRASKDGYVSLTRRIGTRLYPPITIDFTLTKEAAPPPPPDEGTVGFKVIDEKGNPIQGAAIRIANQSALTDGAGAARFTLSAPAEYTWIVGRLGFQETTGGVSLDAGVDMFQEVILRGPPEPPPEPPPANFFTLLDNALNTAIDTGSNVWTAIKDFEMSVVTLIRENSGGRITQEEIELSDRYMQTDPDAMWIALALVTPAPLVKGGLTSIQAAKVSATAINKAASEIIAKGATNPANLAKAFRAFPTSVQREIFANLGRTASGRIATVSLTNAIGHHPALISKILNAKVATGAAAALIGAVSTLIFVDFIAEEAIQSYSMGLFNLTGSGDWQASDEEFPRFKAGIESSIDNIEMTFRIPVLGDMMKIIFQGTIDSARAQLDAFRIKIDEGLAGEAEPTTITVSTDQDPAEAEIVGLPASFVTPFTQAVSPGSYSIVATKDGFEPEARTVYVKEGEETTVTIAFDRQIGGVDPTIGRLQVVVRDSKTNTLQRATLFINNRAEPYHLSTFVIEIQEGTYEIRVEEEGFQPYLDTVILTKGETTLIEVPLVKIDEEPPPPTGVTCESLGYHTEKPDDGKEYAAVAVRGLTCFQLKGATTGRLQISSIPVAEVWILGEKKANETPTTIDLEQGMYDVTLKAEGYVDETLRVYINIGELVIRAVTLTAVEAPPEIGSVWRIDISSQPSGAKILVNYAFTGKWTPDYILLDPGQFLISLVKSGFKEWKTPLTLEEI